MLLDIVHALLAESLTKTGCGICDQAAWRSTAQAKEDEGEETRTPQRGLAHVKLLLVIVAGRQSNVRPLSHTLSFQPEMC